MKFVPLKDDEGESVQDIVTRVAKQYGVPQELAHTIAGKIESGYNPKAVSPAGARGVMQVMPGTAKDMGFDPERLHEKEYGVLAGMKYLKQQLDEFKDPVLAAAAYFAGPGNVRAENWNVKDALGTTMRKYADMAKAGMDAYKAKGLAGKVAYEGKKFVPLEEEEGKRFVPLEEEEEEEGKRFVPLEEDKGKKFVPLEEEEGGLENKFWTHRLTQTPMDDYLVPPRKPADPFYGSRPSEGIIPDIVQGSKAGFLRAWAGLPSILGRLAAALPLDALQVVHQPTDVEPPTPTTFRERMEAAQKFDEELADIIGRKRFEVPDSFFGSAGHFGGTVTGIASQIPLFGGKLAHVPKSILPITGAETALRTHHHLRPEAGILESFGVGALGLIGGLKAQSILKQLKDLKSTRQTAAYEDLILRSRGKSPGEVQKMIEAFAKEHLKPGETVKLSPKEGLSPSLAGAVVKPREKLQSEDLDVLAREINEAPINKKTGFSSLDLKSDRGWFTPGGSSKWSWEPKPYLFDRMGPGPRDAIYHSMKEAEHTGLMRGLAVEAESLRWDRTLSSKERRDLYYYATSLQEGGPETLKKMKVKVPTESELTSAQRAYYDWHIKQFKDYWERINVVRKQVGQEPLPPQPNYFTFGRDIGALKAMEVSPISNLAREFLTPGSLKNKYFIERVQSKHPFKGDPGEIFRNYSKVMENWLAISPEIYKTKDFIGKIQKKAPNMSGALSQWLRNITGTSSTEIGPHVDRLLMAYNKMLTRGTLVFNPRSIIIQVTSGLNTMAIMGMKNFTRGIWEAIRRGDLYKIAQEHSSVLKTREFDVNVQHLLDKMGGRSLFSKTLERGDKYGLTLLQWLDSFMARAAWISSYLKGREDGLTGKALHRFADRWTIKTQASAAMSDRSNIQTHTLGKMFTLFETFALSEWKLLRGEIFKLGGGKPTGQQLARMARYMFGAAIINEIYEGQLGVRSPLAAPFKAMGRSISRGDPIAGALGIGAGEVAGQAPVFGSVFKTEGRRPPGTALSMLMQLGELSGGRLRDKWRFLLQAGGVPGGLGISRALNPEYDLIEKLLGPYIDKKEMQRGMGLGSISKKEKGTLDKLLDRKK